MGCDRISSTVRCQLKKACLLTARCVTAAETVLCFRGLFEENESSN